MRNLEGKIIECSLAKPIEVRIPGASGADIETSFASLLEHLVTRVLDSNRMFLAGLGRFSEYGVKRAVFLPAFLNPIESLPLLICDARDPQVGEQSKFEDSLPGQQRLEGYGRGAEEMIVLGDHGLD